MNGDRHADARAREAMAAGGMNSYRIYKSRSSGWRGRFDQSKRVFAEVRSVLAFPGQFLW
jgi:hypothetical protein